MNNLETGKIYQSKNDGYFSIVKDFGWNIVFIEFISTGYISKATRQQIIKGTVKDRYKPIICGVGFIGGNKYKSKINGNTNPHYDRWVHMLERCYCPEAQKKMPSYKGCSVVKEWHNFQNFCLWCEENYIDGYQIDKDILVPDNKVYGPSFCIFVPPQKNAEFSNAKDWVFYSPEGKKHEIYNLSKFCQENNLTRANMIKVHNGLRAHHKGWKIKL